MFFNVNIYNSIHISITLIQFSLRSEKTKIKNFVKFQKSFELKTKRRTITYKDKVKFYEKRIVAIMTESNNFDIIEVLLTNYSGDWTGQNITREIFSYLDFQSLKRGRLVCISWNNFLTQDRGFWMKVLERKKSYLDYLSGKYCSGNCISFTPNFCWSFENWEDFFHRCEKAKLSSKMIVRLIGRIESIRAIGEVRKVWI